METKSYWHFLTFLSSLYVIINICVYRLYLILPMGHDPKNISITRQKKKRNSDGPRLKVWVLFKTKPNKMTIKKNKTKTNYRNQPTNQTLSWYRKRVGSFAFQTYQWCHGTCCGLCLANLYYFLEMESSIQTTATNLSYLLVQLLSHFDYKQSLRKEWVFKSL